MPTTKMAVTIDTELLAQVDQLVAQHVFPDRSKAIQAAAIGSWLRQHGWLGM